MIQEVQEFGVKMWDLYQTQNRPIDVAIMEGCILPYTDLAIAVTGASRPPGFGKGTYAVDISINSRSRNFTEVFAQAGFLANYPLSTGPVSISYGTPDPQIGGSECRVEGSIIASEIYPENFILSFDDDETNTICIILKADGDIERMIQVNRDPN